MKKIFIAMFVFAAVIVVNPSDVHAQYAGGDALGLSLGGGTLSGLNLIGKSHSLPMMFGASLGVSQNSFALGVTADWWLLHKQLGRVGLADVFIYLGPGVDVSFVIGSAFGVNAGVRMPLGFSWMVDSPGWEKWEILTELVFGVNVIGFWASDSYTGVLLFGQGLGSNAPAFNAFNTIGAGVRLGFRYWF
ncbi:MAG: hypothetical protein R3Y36_07785 [Spirochaetales bacterium]